MDQHKGDETEVTTIQRTITTTQASSGLLKINKRADLKHEDHHQHSKLMQKEEAHRIQVCAANKRMIYSGRLRSE
jgi:hypothetical protein